MGNIIQDIQLQLDETSGPVFWVIDQLYDAANAAQLEVWMNLKDWQQISTNIILSSGNDIIQWPFTTIMIPQYVIYNGVKVFPTTQAQLQDWANNWKSSNPTRPNWYLLWDAYHIRLYPKSDNVYTFQLFGVPWPIEITDGNHDVVNIDPLVRRAIVLRAVAKLMETTQPDLADAKMLESVEWEKRYARQQRNSFGDNIARLRPTTAWDQANFGDIKVGRLFMGTST
jgi:hypothetical protein